MSDTPEEVTIKMYSAREDIYPREIQGRYATLRWLCVFITQFVFYGLPWMVWNGRQAVLFDLAARKFYIFGIVLWPQDFIYLAVLLIICAYSLFLFTAIAGRVWCGFACPQTVYTELFLWIERKIEGTRSAQMRLAKQPWTLEKIIKKTSKHFSWGVLSFWTGFTFVAYFTPSTKLFHEVVNVDLGPWEWFWILFYSLMTYGNAGWMREQVCKYMCPYARFQSAMFDKDTLIVTYDQYRGEPRSANRKLAANSENRLGDCIDCSMCVQVCPTGIDIRKGLQYECIGCAACVDACNLVMTKVDLPRGLIRYSTENAIEQKLSLEQMRQRVMRPRVMIYTGLLLVIVTVFFSALSLRTPLKLDVIRDRGSLGREVEDGMIENVYRLQIMNTDEVAHRFKIGVTGIHSITLVTPDEVSLDATSSRVIPVRVQVAHGEGNAGSNKIYFDLQALENDKLHVNERAVFFVPR